MFDGGGQRFLAADHRGVAGLHRDIDGAADKPGAALGHRDPRRLIVGAGVDVIDAGLQQPDRAARQVNFDALAFEQGAHIQVDPPLRQAELHDLLVELGNVELGVAGQIDRPAADAQFGARFRIGPEHAAGGDRVIDRGGRPGGLSGGMEAELPGNKADPADPGGRLFLCQRRNGGDQGESEEAENEAAHSGPLTA